MRTFAQYLVVGCLLVIPAAAQHGGGHGGGGGYSSGAYYGGFRGYRGRFYSPNRFGYGLRAGYWRYGAFYPYYMYPYYNYAYYGYPYYAYSYYGYPYYAYPSYSYSGPNSPYYDSATAAPVVIYQSPPSVTVYATPQPPETQAGVKTIYLIKLKGQDNVCAAQAYWFTDRALHFITLGGETKQAPISSIDRDLTIQLNRDRLVDFRIPIER